MEDEDRREGGQAFDALRRAIARAKALISATRVRPGIGARRGNGAECADTVAGLLTMDERSAVGTFLAADPLVD